MFEVDSFDNVFIANITSHNLVDFSQTELRNLSETPVVLVKSIGDQSIIQRLQHIPCFFLGTGVHFKLFDWPPNREEIQMVRESLDEGHCDVSTGGINGISGLGERYSCPT